MFMLNVFSKIQTYFLYACPSDGQNDGQSKNKIINNKIIH